MCNEQRKHNANCILPTAVRAEETCISLSGLLGVMQGWLRWVSTRAVGNRVKYRMETTPPVPSYPKNNRASQKYESTFKCSAQYYKVTRGYFCMISSRHLGCTVVRSSLQIPLPADRCMGGTEQTHVRLCLGPFFVLRFLVTSQHNAFGYQAAVGSLAYTSFLGHLY